MLLRKGTMHDISALWSYLLTIFWRRTTFISRCAYQKLKTDVTDFIIRYEIDKHCILAAYSSRKTRSTELAKHIWNFWKIQCKVSKSKNLMCDRFFNSCGGYKEKNDWNKFAIVELRISSLINNINTKLKLCNSSLCFLNSHQFYISWHPLHFNTQLTWTAIIDS